MKLYLYLYTKIRSTIPYSNLASCKEENQIYLETKGRIPLPSTTCLANSVQYLSQVTKR